MELREPKRKHRVRISPQQPFPVLSRDDPSIPTNRVFWQIYTGRYSGEFVVVEAPDEMTALHSMGFFGKGSLSRGAPEFGKERQGTPPFIKQRQWERRCKWAKQQEEMLKHFNTTQKKVVDGRKTDEDISTVEQSTAEPTSTETKETEVDEISSQENKAKLCNEETKRDNTGIVKDKEAKKDNIEIVKDKEAKKDNTEIVKDKEAILNDKEAKKNVDEDKESHNEIITLDSAEEDNGSKKDNEKSDTEEQTEGHEKRGTKRKLVEDLECYSSSVKHCRSDNLTGQRLLLVLPDSDDDDEQYVTNICPRLEKEPFRIHESLHLTLEESFFLSYGLGCLQVIDMFGNCLSIDGMWQLFCKSQKDFIQKYVAYHYFRSKGWVVKPGIKFGGDFLLYKQGPPFYHASYLIVLEVVDRATLKRHPAVRRKLTWTRLLGLSRLTETSGKEVILCQIMWPSEVKPSSLEYASVLSKFQVHEVLVRRWVSSQEREENDAV